MSGFSIIMAYTLFATIYLTVKSMKAVVSGSNSILGDDVFANMVERRHIEEKKVNASTLKEDYYREIRTRLVLIWIVSNATLSMALTEVYSTGLSGTNGYLKCKAF